MKSLKLLFRIGRGPSSSHTMGPIKACEYVLKNYPNKSYDCILYGSLALTGKGHLTDKVIKETLKPNSIKFDILTKTNHPNTLDIIVDQKITLRFESVGGGEVYFENKSLDNNEEIYPFKSFNEIKKYSKDNNLSIPEIVYKFEGKEIKEYLNLVVDTMLKSIENGLNNKDVLPGSLKLSRKAKKIYNESKDELDKTISYAYSVAEENASGGMIVTSPTCGSSGVIPACIRYMIEKHNISKIDCIDMLCVAGIIGNVIKEEASLSGAHLGCQAEIGSACSMAAAMITSYFTKDIEKIECAAENAMEHSLGLTCDPIDGYVQIPCIERNSIFALKAISSSRLSLLPIYPEKISFDTVIKTMKETGIDIKEEYKETSKAGLAKAKL